MTLHNQVRDLIHDYCRRAQLRPQLEAASLLQGPAVDRRRPADVLLPRSGPLLDRLPDGSWRPAAEPLALDFPVNALGQNHRDATFASPAGAAAAYATHKRRHQRTEAFCREAGVTYQPIIFEAQGGMSTEAAALVHRLAAVVSAVEGASALTIRNRLFDQLAVIVARCNGRSIRRRREALPADSSLRAVCADLGPASTCATRCPHKQATVTAVSHSDAFTYSGVYVSIVSIPACSPYVIRVCICCRFVCWRRHLEFFDFGSRDVCLLHSCSVCTVALRLLGLREVPTSLDISHPRPDSPDKQSENKASKLEAWFAKSAQAPESPEGCALQNQNPMPKAKNDYACTLTPTYTY